MTREEARDAIMEILFAEAPNSPRYMGNGGPEIVADMILNRLGGTVRFTREPRVQTSIWVAVSHDEADDVFAIRRIVKGLDTDALDAWVDDQPRHVAWHIFQFWVDAETLGDAVFVVVEMGGLEGPEAWGIEGAFSTQAQAQEAIELALYEWGDHPKRAHYHIDRQTIAV